VDVCNDAIVDFPIALHHSPSCQILLYSFDKSMNIEVEKLQVDVSIPYLNFVILYFRSYCSINELNLSYSTSKLKLDFGVNTVEPGSSVDLRVSSKQNSIVSVCVIDSSIELMKTPLEVTDQLVSNFMKEFIQPKIESYSYYDKDDMKTLKVRLN
jgi:hypothetical protein